MTETCCGGGGAGGRTRADTGVGVGGYGREEHLHIIFLINHHVYPVLHTPYPLFISLGRLGGLGELGVLDTYLRYLAKHM